MELTRHGFQVYTPEVDDRGVDFVARYNGGPFVEVQVKSARKFNYVYKALAQSQCLVFPLEQQDRAAGDAPGQGRAEELGPVGGWPRCSL